MSSRKPPPPFQLVTGDRYNLTLGCIFAFVFASLKDQKLIDLHPFVKWSMNAYTNWNLAFIALRVLLRQSQWDPFLLTNSIGILLGFRTAFCQGLDDNMRKKIKKLGFPLPRKVFVMADHLCHTMPPIALLAALVHRRQRVPAMNSVRANAATPCQRAGSGAATITNPDARRVVGRARRCTPSSSPPGSPSARAPS